MVTERALEQLSPKMRAKVIEGRNIPVRPHSPEETKQRQDQAIQFLTGIPASVLRFQITRGLK